MIECPENICIESNTFCNETEIGDGICQDYNNAQLCDYDGGDCCLDEKGSECCICECRYVDISNYYYDYNDFSHSLLG